MFSSFKCFLTQILINQKSLCYRISRITQLVIAHKYLPHIRTQKHITTLMNTTTQWLVVLTTNIVNSNCIWGLMHDASENLMRSPNFRLYQTHDIIHDHLQVIYKKSIIILINEHQLFTYLTYGELGFLRIEPTWWILTSCDKERRLELESNLGYVNGMFFLVEFDGSPLVSHHPLSLFAYLSVKYV